MYNIGATIFNSVAGSKIQVHEPLDVRIIGALSVTMYFTGHICF